MNALITKKIIIFEDSVQFYVFENLVQNSSIVSDNISIKSIQDIQNALDVFDNISVCRGGAGIDNSLSDKFRQTYQKDNNLKVWRHIQCKYVENLSTTDKTYQCLFCKRTIHALRLIRCRSKNKKTSNRKQEKKRKQFTRLKTRSIHIMKEIKVLREKTKKVDDEDLIKKLESYPNLQSSQKMLIKECIKACKYNKKTSRRYTSEWLLLCLLLHIKSPACYKFLRKNEVLPLPAVSTIRRYLSRVNLKCGLDENFFDAFKIKMQEKNEFERHGMLIFDEMQVRQSVNLNVKNMKLIGIQDFGKDHSKTVKTSDKCADHALVFMFASLAANISQPVAVYGAKGPTNGTCLATLILEIIKKLEQCGVFVDGLVCDGASTNRRMWKEFNISGKLKDTNFKILHPMNDERELFFFSDAPHLIKCVRNRFQKNTVLQVS